MAQIIVRGIEDDVKERLQRRAAQHGHSMEAEVRDILRDAVQRDRRVKPGLGTAIAGLFGGIGLRQGEAIHELRGFTPADPFER
jgi:antitoxin FitA